MVSFRPPPTKSGQWLRLGLTALVAVHVVMSAWIVVQFDGVYTEGAPAPSEIHALIAIDKDQTLIDVKIERATALFMYSLNRDSSATIEGNGTINSNNTDDSKNSADTNEESSENLNLTRKITLGLLATLVFCEVLLICRVSNFSSWLRTFVWFVLIAFFVIVIPLSYVSDLGGIEGVEFGSEKDVNAMVHIEDSSNITIVPLGLKMDYQFGGYDLGLINPENRSEIIANPPPSDSEEAKSWIRFESEFSIAMGKNLDTLVFFPIVWFFIPAFSAENDDESTESTKKYTADVDIDESE
jgi:hypothetical protein